MRQLPYCSLERYSLLSSLDTFEDAIWVTNVVVVELVRTTLMISTSIPPNTLASLDLRHLQTTIMSLVLLFLNNILVLCKLVVLLALLLSNYLAAWPPYATSSNL